MNLTEIGISEELSNILTDKGYKTETEKYHGFKPSIPLYEKRKS